MCASGDSSLTRHGSNSSTGVFLSWANRSNKFQRDIQLLKQGLADDPSHDRYSFYLGQSYFDLKQYAEAIPYYQTRIAQGGWDEDDQNRFLCKLEQAEKLKTQLIPKGRQIRIFLPQTRAGLACASMLFNGDSNHPASATLGACPV